MEQICSIFDMFGGIRAMARHLGANPSRVMAWKRTGRIPADSQPHVLDTALQLGLPVTAEHVVYPLGRHDTSLAEAGPSVSCDNPPRLQGSTRA